MRQEAAQRRSVASSIVRWTVVAVVAALGFLPLGVQGYAIELRAWLRGVGVVLALTLAIVALTRSRPAWWRAPALASLTEWYRDRPRAAQWLIAIVAFAVYAVAAQVVFDGRPLNIDELAQLVQARIFTAGRLWLPAPAHLEFFGVYHIIDTGGKVYSQFPAGGPAMLALGELLRAPWLVGPICGALGVAAFAWYLRAVESRAGVALGALLMFAFAPFVVFMSATYMNHAPTLMWLMIGVAALAHLTRSASPRPALALVVGLALGCAATIRPVEAVAFAIPAGIWLLARALRERSRWSDALAAALGVAIPLAALMWLNSQTTGAPLRFGYEVMWGSAHGLGFHRDPSGALHTPLHGLALINLYFVQLQSHMFEAPLPALIPVLAALALIPRFDAYDRYWLAASALLVAAYFSYWFSGDYLGPRFLYPLAPVLALWTARLPLIVRDRWGSGARFRGTIAAYAVSAIGALTIGIPARAHEYEKIGPLERWDASDAAALAGARNALVLVRESWGGQLIARLWALGISRSDASFLYRRVDTCVLSGRLDAVESRGLRGDAALAALAPLMADSARLLPSPFSPRTGERALPGLEYGPSCRSHIAENAAGFLPYQPFIVARGNGNVFARDLGARDTILLAEHTGAPVYSVRVDLQPGGRGVFIERVSRDSIVAAARASSRSAN
ncbi:MAG TPA: hypothetical protein VIB98_06575 [Gemmatimonadaceae bacterium]